MLRHILVSIAFLSPLAVHAQQSGLFVEPGMTYSSYESSIRWPSPFTHSDGEVKGFGLLARVGFHINEVLFIAADGRYSAPKFKDSTNNLDASAKQYDVGPTIGIQMPNFGLRVWGTYVAASELDPESSNNVDFKFGEGQGYRVGAGFRVFALSLNLEYQKIDYGKTTIQQLGPFTGGDTDVKFKGDGFVASVSFPLEI